MIVRPSRRLRVLSGEDHEPIVFAQGRVGLVNSIPRVHLVVVNFFRIVKITSGQYRKVSRYSNIALYEKAIDIQKIDDIETRVRNKNATVYFKIQLPLICPGSIS